MTRRLLFSLSLAAILLFPVAVQAQVSCDSCDPYNSGADEGCWYCDSVIDYIDTCPSIGYSTCGEYRGAGLQSGCWPNWVATDRVNVGTYGESNWGIDCTWTSCWPVASCDHHRVDRVTEHDTNQCNINPGYWDKTECDDYVDASKPWQNYWPPDCCSPVVCVGYPNPLCFYNATFTCNDWHSCY